MKPEPKVLRIVLGIGVPQLSNSGVHLLNGLHFVQMYPQAHKISELTETATKVRLVLEVLPSRERRRKKP